MMFLEGVFPSEENANNYVSNNQAPEGWSFRVYRVLSYL